jgi:DNA repair protein RadC
MEQAKISIKNWADDDKPREKLLLKGRSALSDAELIAILIGTGNLDMSAVELSQHILSSVGNNLNELGRVQVSDLQRFKGIGEAKAISIVAAMELGRRRKEQQQQQKKKITTSKDAYEEFVPNFQDLLHEEFGMLILSRSNEVIKKHIISRGGVSGTVVDPKMVFNKALETLGSAIILCHNHPSGNLKPSDADIKLTKKMVEAGRILDIPVLDHIIFTDNGYYSFADEGVM